MHKAAMIGLSFFYLALIVGLNIYLPKRLAGLLGIKSAKALYALFFAVTIATFVSMGMVARSSLGIVNAGYLVSSTWMGAFLFLSCFMALFEAVNLFVKLPRRAAALGILSLTAAVTVFALMKANGFSVSQVEVPVKGITKDVRIMHLSDIHLGATRGKAYLEKIVAATNAQNPDLVAITGDIVDSRVGIDARMLEPLNGLKAPAYFIIGNHDAYAGLDRVTEELKRNGVVVLRNEVVETGGIQLIGLDYMNPDENTYDVHRVSKATVKEVVRTIAFSPDKPKVLLHHGPGGIEYMNRHGVDLVLAGHTHAGQIFPASLAAEWMFPYSKGLHEYKGTYIHVSQGAGTFFSRMRLGTNNEITLVTLKPATRGEKARS